MIHPNICPSCGEPCTDDGPCLGCGHDDNNEDCNCPWCVAGGTADLEPTTKETTDEC